MSLPEPQDELLERIDALERSNRRWKTIALTMGAIFALLLLVTAVLGITQQQRALADQRDAEAMARLVMEQERQAREQAEQAREAEREAREQAQQDKERAEAERQRDD